MPTASRVRRGALLAALALVSLTGSCGADDPDEPAGALAGRVEVVAGGTSYSFAQAAADQFRIEQPDVTVAVERTNPAGAFERFCDSAADAAASPRPINQREQRLCAPEEHARDERLPSDGTGDPVHLYVRAGERATAPVRAWAAFVAAHHDGIADAARRGARALSD